VTALFTFEIGFSPDRPITPDADWTWVTLLGEDTPRGLIDARWAAIAMASGCRVNAMVTSARLLHAEI
jgi:hypothetical protein